jgi:hypothetical protein
MTEMMVGMMPVMSPRSWASGKSSAVAQWVTMIIINT